MTCQLYRHFDSSGALLYVGISVSTPARLAQHRDSSEWFSRIDKITICHFETVADARNAEREAIATERPMFNCMWRASSLVRPDHGSPVTPENVIRHYGGERQAADALQVTRQIVNYWKRAGVIPLRTQAWIQLHTSGALVASSRKRGKPIPVEGAAA